MGDPWLLCVFKALVLLLPSSSSLLSSIWLSAVHLTHLKSMAVHSRGGATQASTTNYPKMQNIHRYYVHA